MENYESQPCHIEHEVEIDPFDDPRYFHIEVLQDKSVKNLVNRGLKNFGPGKPLVWFAEGRAVPKAVSCAEILKTYYKKPIHQITKVNQMRTMETWAPLVQELDCLKVTRSVPMIYILMSLEPLEVRSLGYQKSNSRQPKRTITMSELEAALAEESLVSSPSPSPKESNSKSPPPTPSQ